MLQDIYIYIIYVFFYICAQMLICFMYLYFNTHTYIILIVTGMGKYQKLMVSGGLLTSILWLLFGTGEADAGVSSLTDTRDTSSLEEINDNTGRLPCRAPNQ
jgi:hypothetical protein